jgi:hypothetical protein
MIGFAVTRNASIKPEEVRGWAKVAIRTAWSMLAARIWDCLDILVAFRMM